MSLPFDSRAPGYYEALGARERRALPQLEPLRGDGVVGSMSAAWREWRRKGAPRLLVQWLRSGVPLKWHGPAPRQGQVGEGAQSEELKRELRGLLRDGAFARGEAAIIAPTFLIPKKDGTMRLIHDLRETNKHILPPRFTLHGARDAAAVTRNSSWLAVLDLKHGYQQVAMEPSARKFLGARLGEDTVVSTVLPFGLNLSPYVFTRLTGWLARQVRERFGLETAVYIDDFLFGASSEEALAEGIAKVKEFFSELGVVISTKKEVRPANKVEFIGFTWDARSKTVGVPRERRREYRRAVKNLLRHPQTRATWRRVIGKLGFLREAVGPTMRHIRSLLHTVASRRSEGGLLAAAGEARQDLEWWCQTLRHETELSLAVAPVTASVTTDASDGGLGFVMDLASPGGGTEGQTQHKGSMVPEHPESHINKKEIEAVLRALQRHRTELRGRRIVWYSDSTTAVAAIRRQGTQKLAPGTWEVTKEVLDLAEQERITILPKHVPGRLNGAADALSRPFEQRSEWERALELVTQKWGPLEEDPCGATREPTCLLEGLEWASRRTLLQPKIWELDLVMKHLALCASEVAPEGHPSMWKGMAVLVTPCWRGASWWPKVVEMRKDYIHLGRLSSEDMRGWSARNGHAPDWTASLVPLKTPCGRAERGRNMRQCCLDSSDGRSTGDSDPSWEDSEVHARLEA